VNSECGIFMKVLTSSNIYAGDAKMRNEKLESEID
jgi:hypothetical protein